MICREESGHMEGESSMYGGRSRDLERDGDKDEGMQQRPEG